MVLDDSVVLPEGAGVQIDFAGSEKIAEEVGATLCERLKSVIGTAQGLPPDAALNVDHYLYGQPKR